MNGTITGTQTTTYTEARARYVIDKVFEDFTALIIRGFATQDEIRKWKDDLLYIMNEEALTFFEVQLKKPDGQKVALKYYVKSDNSLSQDSSSGNLGLYGLPMGTTANLCAELNKESKNYNKVHNELHTNRGWGYGNNVEGIIEKQHAYSKEGYGVERNKIGNW